MTGPSHGMGAVRPEPAAEWFGRRLCGTLVPDASGIVQPVAWSLHQWMQGHTCLELDGVVTARGAGRGDSDLVEWAVPRSWFDDLRGHPAVTRSSEGSLDPLPSPLVLEGRRLFLGRWRMQEIEVASSLLARSRLSAIWSGDPESTRRIGSLVAARCGGLHEAQRAAVLVAATRRLAVITGGPGTGKTFVAARVIEAVLDAGPQPVLLLAPTGKAAARLQASARAAASGDALTGPARECILSLQASTVHAATMRRGGEEVRRARLVVVDECSMIDLERMHALLRLLHPDATLLMLGDPHQLASVEAGTVLADIVHGTGSPEHPLAGSVAPLRRSHRFAEGSAVARLAAAVNGGRGDEVIAILSEGHEEVRWVPASTSRQVVDASLQLLEGMERAARILCGHRHGPDGSIRMNAEVERRRGVSTTRGPYSGRPILVTVNDDVTGLRNGDTGQVVREAGEWFVRLDGQPVPIPLSRLPAHETAYALTIHRTQGSEYESAVVALPARPSPVLTRELLYTGFTRVRERLMVVASEATLRAAVERPIRRSSGLRERLRSGLTSGSA